MKPSKYFNKNQENYDSKREKGFLGKIVKKERKIVLSLLRPSQKEKILDLGCGEGGYSVILEAYGCDVTGVDISRLMVESVEKKGIKCFEGNIEKINLNKKFDKVLCAGALEFVNSPNDVMSNASRHLIDGGLFVCLYPKYSIGGIFYMLYHLIHGFKIRLFHNSEIKKTLLKNGFSQISFKSGGLNCEVVVAIHKMNQ